MKKFNLTLLLAIFAILSTIAQVDLEINDNMTVETIGGLSIELSGKLVETGTGYLKGVVTSGVRAGGIATFAGLDLTTGSVSKITRTTGSVLSSISPKTSLRYYELVNSSAFSTDVTSEFIPIGSNNESNGITEAYLFTKNGTTWKGYSDNGSLLTSIMAANVNISNGTSNIAISEGSGVGATILLEGPYSSGSLMTNTNNSNIPLLSPYSEAPRTASSIPATAVDWVLVELRTGTSAATSVGYRSAFIDVNGNLINDSGSAGIGFPSVPADYYLVLKHRNHLAAMSNTSSFYRWITQ
jgi:hypothetical protein